MARTFTLLFLFAFVLFALPSDAQSERTNLPVRIRSASELDYPPFAIVSAKGGADGFSVELLKAACAMVGIEPDIKVGPWSVIKQELKDGDLDALPLVSFSQERDEYFDFSAPYLRMHGTIFVRKGEKGIRDENDLDGREVLVMRGDTAHEYALRNHLTDKLMLTDTFAEAMTRLSRGQHDAVIVQQLVGWQLLRELGINNVVDVQRQLQDDLKPTEKPLLGFEQKFCFAVREGDAELLSLLNEGLAIVITNGTYNRLYQKWFGPILPESALDLKQVVRLSLYVIVPFILVSSLVGIILLRQQVRQKTVHLTSEIERRKRTEKQLKESTKDAERANKAKSMFLANMSHELRTPINGIVGMHQLLLTTNLDEEQQEFLKLAESSCTRLTDILSGILDLSRIEAEVLEINRTPFIPARLLREVAVLFEPSARQTGLDLRVEVDPALDTTVLGDDLRLQQVFTNLLGNAFKFTAQGEVGLTAYRLSSPNEGALRMLVTVSDTGIGFPEDQIDDLLKPFAQAEGDYRRRFQGAGLGLSIVRSLVALMGGDIAIESEEGKGTSFHLLFTLPLSQKNPARTDGNGNTAPRSATDDKRVLIVEDDAVNRFALEHQLKKIGVPSVSVENGQQCLDRLAGGAFDLVLLDVQMPVMDGIETVGRIREGIAAGSMPDVPVIAITAHAMRGDKERFLQQGFDDYLAKPIRFDALSALLKARLGI